jgi:hypothetical protein
MLTINGCANVQKDRRNGDEDLDEWLELRVVYLDFGLLYIYGACVKKASSLFYPTPIFHVSFFLSLSLFWEADQFTQK